MSTRGYFRKRGRFAGSRSGAIEGFPLYLIIIIVITVLGLGIVLGLMNTVKPPTTLDKVNITPEVIEVKDPDGDGTYNVTGKTVTVKVIDSNGDPVKGAVVRLTGCNVKDGGKTAYGTTDGNGEYKFTQLYCEVVGTDTGHIDVEVEKSGLGKKTGRMTVIPVT
jgi:hypothetical protein